MGREIIFMIVICILCVVILGLCLRLFLYKSQVRSFAKRTRERKEEDMNQPVTVDLFQKDFLELANALNAYTDQQKQMVLELARDRERLNYVIAGISHDFRTPLTAAIGYMQMVDKSGDLQEKSQEYLDVALEKTRFLKELSDAFFELSTLEAKQDEVTVTNVNLQKLLQEVILEQFSWISEKKLQTEFQIPDKDIFMECNEQYMKRILDNLFSNMRKYAVSYVKVSLESVAEQVTLSVENDVQDPDIDCTRIFEPFYRGESRSKQGSGLGLYVVKCLADKMGMNVTAKVEAGRFIVQLRNSRQ